MISTRQITILILIVIAVILIAWDIYAYISVPNAEATISDTILDFARKHTVFPFIFGVLGGHLFWPQYVND